MSNSYGTLFRITTFGESHGKAIGVVIDGCPAGIAVDESFIQSELDRRRPGQSRITTQRREADRLGILSGVFEGKTTGMPIALLIHNTDAKSKDYAHIAESYRPSHADFTYQQKYGIRDYRGGGRSSARETAARVAAGALAKLVLMPLGVVVKAYVSQAGVVKTTKSYLELDLSKTEDNIVRCPDEKVAEEMIAHIDAVRKSGDTVGGIVTGVITGAPVGLGNPVFDKLHARLGAAMLGINAVKGFEYGSGFGGANMRGSVHNDPIIKKGARVSTQTNHSGGIQGGLTNGEDIYFRVAFKPVATIMHDQNSLNHHGESVVVAGRGRHDPCVVPRAVPIVEAMAALTLVDFYLLHQATLLKP